MQVYLSILADSIVCSAGCLDVVMLWMSCAQIYLKLPDTIMFLIDAHWCVSLVLCEVILYQACWCCSWVLVGRGVYKLFCNLGGKMLPPVACEQLGKL